MAKVRCRAVIMDYAGDGENAYEFEADDNLFDRPADEVVDAFIQHIDATGTQNEPFRYELNAASSHCDNNKRLVTAMGSLLLKDGSRLPFIAMITPA